MSDLTVSVTNQNVTVSPSTQALTVTVPYVDMSGTAPPMALDDLTDVTMVGTANGYILRYNGTAWSGVPGSTYFAAASHTHPQSDVTGLVAFVANTNATLLDQADQIAQAQFDISNLQTAPPAHTHTASQISDSTTAGRALLTAADAPAQRSALVLGTAATVDYPATGNASSSQLVRGNDTRLTDSRTPTSHVHSYADITSGYPALTYAQNILGSDNSSIATGSFTLVGTGLSLAAGTWLVSSTMTISHSNNTATTVIRIASSSGTVYASTEARNPATVNQSVSESTCCVIVLGSTTTVQHECRTSIATATVKASTTTATSSNATILTAVRIA